MKDTLVAQDWLGRGEGFGLLSVDTFSTFALGWKGANVNMCPGPWRPIDNLTHLSINLGKPLVFLVLLKS